MVRIGTKMALAAFGIAALAGCGTSSGGSGASVSEMFLFAGTSVPPEAPRGTVDVYCPTVGVIEGGTAIQAYSGGRVGDAAALRNQIALGRLARECAGQPDGSTLVKVGVEGRALLGAGAGSAGGRFDVPVRIVVKQGSTILANRALRTSVTVPAGQSHGSFALVEDGFVVPPGAAQDFEIEVGLGNVGPQTGAGRRG
jgi:hypothetical protein